MRLAFICTEPVSSADQHWWKKAVGSEPAAIATQTAQREHREFGLFEGKELGLVTRFNQIEWILRRPQSAGATFDIPDIGTAEDSLHALDDVLIRWVAESKISFQRFAICPIFFRPAETLEEAASVFCEYVPSFKGRGAEDLLAQFNIPKARSTSFPEIRINRILKIGQGQVQTIALRPSGPVVEIKVMTRAEFDFNTSVERTSPIPADVFPQLLEEMHLEIHDVLSKGVL